MSDLNIRNNLHVGIEFDAQGDNLVATVTPQTVGAAPTIHTHEIAQVNGLQTALNNKQDVGGNFDTRYLRIDAEQVLGGVFRSQGRSNLGLGSAAVLNAPSGGDAGPGEVVLGDDSRLTGGGGGGGGAVYTDLGNVSGSVTVDLDNNNETVVSLRLTGNVTLTFSNVPSDYAVSTLLVAQDGTGSRTVSVSGSVTILNGGDGSINPAANSRSVMTFVTANGGSTFDLAVADSRPNQYEAFYMNPPANGEYYITFPYAVTLALGSVYQRGAGSLAYAKSTNGTTFSAVSGSTSFAANDVLRVTVSGFSGWLSLTIPRTA